MEEIKVVEMPIVALRGIVAFPGNTLTFEAARKDSVTAINSAMKDNKTIFLTSQINPEKENPKESDLFKIGTVARISQSLNLPGGIIRVICNGLYKAVLVDRVPKSRTRVRVTQIFDKPLIGVETDAAVRELKHYFQELFEIDEKITTESMTAIEPIENPVTLCNAIASVVPFSVDIMQTVLETNNILSKIEFLCLSLINEIEIVKLKHEIDTNVKKKIDKSQREYYLHEQLKVIEEELGGNNGMSEEISEYNKKIDELELSEEISEKLHKEVSKLNKISFGNPEGSVVRNYLDSVLSLPWNTKTEENMSLENAEQILDRDHYGLEKVKERVIEHLAVRNFNAKGGTILCLVGPPGVGKTSIVKSIAESLNRNYVRISLGGVHDEADIRGHRKTYIGAMMGRIMSAVAQAGSNNALVLLDEIDKVGSDYRGDPSAALLEVLDSEQNFSFRDHYIEVPFDLSNILFITTANTLDTINRPLLDRMEVVNLSGYTNEEKFNIAKRYLFNKALKKTGLENKKITLTDEAITELIDYYTREAGVRNLERALIRICQKCAKKFIQENKRSIKITRKLVNELLGKRIYSFDLKNENDEVGVARGLAFTAVGGETLSIEVNVMKGKGKIELTGKLGDVMKESAMAAISYVRANSEDLKIDDFYDKSDIHIHVPEGAVPKDGPSAGITMATAIVSALTKRPVKSNLAMTGEITLRGRVLPIGGLKEKSLAAYRAGITNVIIPYGNKKDLDEFPKVVLENIKFIPVKNMSEVLKVALA